MTTREKELSEEVARLIAILDQVRAAREPAMDIVAYLREVADGVIGMNGCNDHVWLVRAAHQLKRCADELTARLTENK